MEYDKKLFDEAVEMRNRNAQRSKKWIYEGEFRKPKAGDSFIDDGGGARFAPFGRVIQTDMDHAHPYAIVRPIPDDVVMVPRERIEALRDVRKNPPYAAAGIRFALPTPYHPIVDAILACVEPEKPKDEILEALRRCRNTMNRDRINCTTDIIQVTDAAIALREKEIEERGE